MARRIRSRKTKHLGNRTYGGGNTKNRRGKGNRGGVGRAGVGKHRRLFFIKTEGSTLRDRGLQGFDNPNKRKQTELSLEKLQKMLDAGKYELKDGAYSLDLPHTKIISNGSFTAKATIKAAGFSAKAAEKIKAAGGTATAY